MKSRLENETFIWICCEKPGGEPILILQGIGLRVSLYVPTIGFWTRRAVWDMGPVFYGTEVRLIDW